MTLRRVILATILLSLYLAACTQIHHVSHPYAISPLPTPRSYYVYMPYLSIGGLAASGLPCVGNTIEQQLTFLFVTDPEQKRQRPTCDPRLARAAQHRAQDMVDNKYFGHLDLEGRTPNYWARAFGCALPDWYPAEGNQIESLGLNYASAGDVWQGWLNSPGHRMHVLGTVPFWAEQTSFGIAVAESAYGRVFVLMTAPDCDGG